MPSMEELQNLAQLIRSQRWAALATLDEHNLPLASTVAYVPEPDFQGFLLHLSRLAQHTQNLLHNPAASLVISQPDQGQGLPQTLARVSLRGEAHELTPGSPDFEDVKRRYIERLPESEAIFDFTDFILFRLIPRSARYVGGFGRTYSFSPEDLRRAAEASIRENP